MAITFVKPQEVEYKPLDLQVIDTSLMRDQERFDKANETIAKQMNDAANQGYLDPIARTKVMADIENSFVNTAEKYRGRLGDNYQEVLRTVYTNAQNPWFNTNKAQLAAAAEEQKLASEFGEYAIKRSNVREASLLDQNTGQILSAQDVRLKPNVVKAADYQTIGMQLGQWLQADKRDLLLRKYKGDSEIQGFLQSGDITELSEEKVLKLVNDSAVQDAFRTQAATYAIDNRANVGYDPTTGKNMFTADLKGEDRKKFKSGVSKYLYGVLKQKIYEQRDSQYIEDPNEARRIAAGAGAAEEQALFDASLKESTYDFATAVLGTGYKPSFSGGRLVANSRSGKELFKDRSELGNAGFNAGLALSGFDSSRIMANASSDKDMTAQERQAQQLIDSMRKRFKARTSNMNDEQVWNAFVNSSTMGKAMKDLAYQPDRAAVVRKELLADISNASIEVGGKIYRAAQPTEAAAFKNKYNISIQEAFASDKAGFFPSAVRGVAQHTGKSNTKKGGTMLGTLYDSTGTPYNATVTSNNTQINAAYEPANQAFEAMRTLKNQRVSLQDPQGNPKNGIAIPYMQKDGTMSVITVPAVMRKRGKDNTEAEYVVINGMRYAADDHDNLQSVITDLAATSNGEQDLQAKLLQKGMDSYGFETLLLAGHDKIWRSNKLGVSPSTKGQSLTNEENTAGVAKYNQ